MKSAGNRGDGSQTLTTPADAEGVIVVGATDRAGSAVQSYSSRGPTGGGLTRPHLCAPGGSPEDGITSCLVQGGFGNVTHGTSFAAPHVTGLAALLLANDPALDPDEVRDLLIAACTPRGRWRRERSGRRAREAHGALAGRLARLGLDRREGRRRRSRPTPR